MKDTGLDKIEVASSNIDAIGYNTSTETLRVWFLNGQVWDFYSVQADVFESFKDAASTGTYFAKNIKGKYKSERVWS
ncbi:MAG TPA: KTSC domain-containing protein [Puia sp.]|jgi:hypothetical protein|nr:KTSC domain-containing protein [Puia sp.]